MRLQEIPTGAPPSDTAGLSDRVGGWWWMVTVVKVTLRRRRRRRRRREPCLPQFAPSISCTRLGASGCIFSVAAADQRGDGGCRPSSAVTIPTLHFRCENGDGGGVSKNADWVRSSSSGKVLEVDAVGLLSSGLLWEVLQVSGDDLQLWAAKPNDGSSKDGSGRSIADEIFCAFGRFF